MRKQRTLYLFSVLVVTIALGFSGLQSVYAEKEDEIVLAAPRDIIPGEEDFYYASVIVSVWESLVSVDENWNPVPGLASSWEMSKDAKEWMFTLRQGVTFHDGEPFNADAVIANFERYQKNTPGTSKFYWLTMNTYYPGFKGIEKIDEYTVKLLFDKPLPTLIYFMTTFGSPMFSPKCFNEEGKFITTAAGTGPFQVVERVDNQYAVLERFENYYGPKAGAKRVRIKVIPDGNTRFSALRAEEILGVLDFGSIHPNLANELIKDDRFAVTTSKSSIMHNLYVNGEQFPLNDVRIRKAISLIIDRQLIADEFWGGYPMPAPHILNYASPFYRDLPIEHDPEKAKQLAQEVLGTRRVSIDLIVRSSDVQRFPYKEQGEYLQAVLAELGLDVNLQVLESGARTDALKKGNYHLSMGIRGLDNGEPTPRFVEFMKSDGRRNRDYHQGYRNEDVERLLNKLGEILDQKEREKVYDRLQTISVEDMPVIPLLNDATVLVYNKKITGYNALIYGVTLPKIRWAE